MDPLTSPDRCDQQEDAERRTLQGFAGPDIPQVQAHEERDGDGCSDRENAPWTFGEHLHDNQPEHRQKDDHDRQDRHQGQCTQERIQFVLHHLTQGTAVATHGCGEDEEVLGCTAKDDSNQDPQGSGKVTELGGEHGAHEGTWSGDGGEVVPEDDPAVGLYKLSSIFMAFTGRGPSIIEHQDFGGDPA